jgi:hypothetical protein
LSKQTLIRSDAIHEQSQELRKVKAETALVIDSYDKVRLEAEETASKTAQAIDQYNKSWLVDPRTNTEQLDQAHLSYSERKTEWAERIEKARDLTWDVRQQATLTSTRINECNHQLISI